MRSHQPPEAKRFEAYLERMNMAVAHADRREPLRAYLSGLLLPGERKSVEPMAAKLDPLHVQARHQSLHHFVAQAPWPEQKMLRVARDYVLAALERHAPVAAWVVDDTGIPKKGSYSVGVAHQYCGVLGKSANCQVAVTVSLVNAVLSVPSGFRLYLPEEWAQDSSRRRAAGVPPDVEFQTKGKIALAQIDELLAEEVPRAPVVADAGYGVSTGFREALSERGLSYVVGILPETSLWAPGEEPLPPAPTKGLGRRPKLLRRTTEHRPISARELAQKLPCTAWKTIRWRNGTKGMMLSRFAAIRVRAAHRDYERTESREPEWLLVQWPSGEKEPTIISTGFPRFPRRSLLRTWSAWRRFDGVSSATFKSSKTSLGWTTTKGEGGEGFIITPPYASPLMLSWQPSELGFPPQRLLPSSVPLAYPKISGHGVRRRPERHNPASIATLRWRQARVLVTCLPHCPWCGHLETGGSL